ncbi:hypothetical protein PG1C_02720 [Rugosibacter aromaticivorans]|uniref:Uncharacterized protein n=1 Tax=Rugosibacter aromaticivorans TaxID=1565605 RepID=A0A0C5IY80_9PROT|nr:hypothetical protein PG1C_02720 [Rugosibacter aromaticivorans]
MACVGRWLAVRVRRVVWQVAYVWQATVFIGSVWQHVDFSWGAATGWLRCNLPQNPEDLPHTLLGRWMCRIWMRGYFGLLPYSFVVDGLLLVEDVAGDICVESLTART